MNDDLGQSSHWRDIFRKHSKTAKQALANAFQCVEEIGFLQNDKQREISHLMFENCIKAAGCWALMDGNLDTLVSEREFIIQWTALNSEGRTATSVVYGYSKGLLAGIWGELPDTTTKILQELQSYTSTALTCHDSVYKDVLASSED